MQMLRSTLNDKIEETQIINCFVCTQWYNLKDKLPISICQNRHTLCMECVKGKMFKKQYDVSNNFTGRFQCPKCYQALEETKFKQDPLLTQICTLIYAIKQKQQVNTKKARQTYGTLVEQKLQMKQMYESKIAQFQKQKNDTVQKRSQLQKAVIYQKQQNLIIQTQLENVKKQLENQKIMNQKALKQKNEEIDQLKYILKMKSEQSKILRDLTEDNLNQLETYKTLYGEKQAQVQKLKKQISELKKSKTLTPMITVKSTPKLETQSFKSTLKESVVTTKKQSLVKTQTISQFLTLGSIQKAQGFSIKGQRITKRQKKGFFGKAFSKVQDQDSYISIFSDAKISSDGVSVFKVKIISTSLGAICYGVAPDALKGKLNIFNDQLYIGYRGINGKVWVQGKWKQGSSTLKKAGDTIKIIVDLQKFLIKFVINQNLQEAVSVAIPSAMKNIRLYPVISMKCQQDSVQFQRE